MVHSQGVHSVVRCVDVAVRAELDATGPVVEYAFGDACDHPVQLDLAHLHVLAEGRDASGAEYELDAFDPRHEIEPLPLDAFASGHERISYTSVEARAPTSICVDVGSIDRAATHAEQWICQAMAPSP